ncbi:MAG: tetratricopeptide repeat protein [Bacteroidota bacterium]
MNDQLHQIDRYLAGKMTEAERLRFEQRLSEDKDLSQALAQREALRASIEAYGDRELKAKLKGIHRNIHREEPAAAPPRRIGRWLAVAAAVLLLLALGYWLFPRSSSPEQLYAQYYAPYDIPFTSRGDNPDRMLQEAADYFGQEGYAIALPLFRQLLQKEPQQPSLRFAEALCLLEMGKLPEAERSFKQVVQLPNPFYLDHARWYLALIYLRQSQIYEARRELERLVRDSRADHHEEAKALSKTLKENF